MNRLDRQAKRISRRPFNVIRKRWTLNFSYGETRIRIRRGGNDDFKDGNYRKLRWSLERREIRRNV